MTAHLHRRLLIGMIDLLLLVPAALLVVGEHILWQGARMVLRALAGQPLVRALHLWLGLLPPHLALPLFLIPTAFSHAAEVGTAFLLAKGHFASATLLVILGKGLATLILVWIYQACEPALLRVRWFARFHHAMRQLRLMLLAGCEPVWRLSRAGAQRVASRGSSVGMRFRHWRTHVAVALRLDRPDG